MKKKIEFNSLEELCDKVNEGELKTGKFTIEGATIYRPNGISIGLDEVSLIAVYGEDEIEFMVKSVGLYDFKKVHFECFQYDHKVIVEAAQDYVDHLKDYDFISFEKFICDEEGSKEYYNYFVMKYLEEKEWEKFNK